MNKQELTFDEKCGAILYKSAMDIWKINEGHSDIHAEILYKAHELGCPRATYDYAEETRNIAESNDECDLRTKTEISEIFGQAFSNIKDEDSLNELTKLRIKFRNTYHI